MIQTITNRLKRIMDMSEKRNLVWMLVLLLFCLKAGGQTVAVKTDLVNWSYPESDGKPETKTTTEHEDAWAPYEYTFTPDNYLDVVNARCTLKTFVDGKLTNTTYVDDEYRFTYE